MAAGAYKPTADTDRTKTFTLLAGVALYGGFAGTESSRDQRDWAGNVTILSGDIGTPDDASDNSYHVVTGTTGATLDGFTVTGGNADTSGGGLQNLSASPTIAHCTFMGNSATENGGAVHDLGPSAPTFIDCTFVGNSAGNGEPCSTTAR